MKKHILLLTISIFSSFIFFGQDDKEISAIVDEGKKLYRSEMASWYGTDIFLEKHPDKRPNLGGYFSYVENDIAKCVFFTKENPPKVIGTISFDSTYNMKTAVLNDSVKEFTLYEKDIYLIRHKALSEVNSDSLFKVYNRTDLNLIPLIDKKGKRVFVITGPKENGIVLFGNDYLLSFDEKNNLTGKKQFRIHDFYRHLYFTII
jgi:hypothetical protein